jgi:FKBP-type peptidyl-prolyl cis-trans isomerase (trigger factor)
VGARQQDSLSYQLNCTVQPSSHSAFCTAVVTVPTAWVNALYHQVTHFLQHSIQAPGFAKGEVPFGYIQQTFHTAIIEHLKEFLFNYCVLESLYHEVERQKLIVAGNPRLIDIELAYDKDAHFTFEITLFPSFSLLEWKYFVFKAPRRKNYKDLDRQVDSFIKEEKEHLKCYHENTGIEAGDWVHCSITVIDADKKPLLPTHRAWFKIGNEEVDSPLRELFLGKHPHDSFVSSIKALQEYFSDNLTTNYHFAITINDVLKHMYFCFEQFKRHFRLKTNKELMHKLIEVFSYRNDLSQRRSTIEETFKLLLSKHRFEVPSAFVLRQQEELLARIQTNPDYHVYRMQKDFQARLEQLAEKQAKECLLLDHIAYQENIVVEDDDIKAYLNLTQRPRMKEFIYFDPPVSKIRGQEYPIAHHTLKQICMREKTLNHIIYHLTRK